MAPRALVLAACAAVTAAARPNILLLFPDQWRYDWDGLHDTLNTGALPLRTPTMRKLAAAGTRFTQAYVPAPVCAPSRACLASGREYDRAGVPDNTAHDYPVGQTTFYTLLRDAGYHTMTTGKDDLTKATQLGSGVGYKGCPYCTAGDGLYHQEELGFSDGLRHSGKMDVVRDPDPHEMYGYYLRNQTVARDNGEKITAWDAHKACLGKGDASLCTRNTYYGDLYEDNWVAKNAVALLDRAPKDKPWFLHVSFPGPHGPFVVTADMHDSVAGRVWPGPTDSKQGPRGQVCDVTHEPGLRDTRCNYAAEVENIDGLFARVLAAVEARGEAASTIVCATSDHGELLNDHNDTGKSKPWQGSASVPLVCGGPGIVANKTVSRPVATVDLSATFLDFAGVTPAEGMTAVSLKTLLAGGTEYKDYVSSGLGTWRMVVQDATSDDRATSSSFKYICCRGACPGAPSTAPRPINGWTEVLIDVKADPFDMHDLAPANPVLSGTLRQLLPKAYAEGCGGRG